MEPEEDVFKELQEYISIEEDAREQAAARLAHGKGVLPTERHNVQAEARLVDEMVGRASGGERFPSSLPHHPSTTPKEE